MRAVVFQDGEVLVEERPDPQPGAGEVLVRVRAAGLNGADMMQRRGMYPPPPGASDVPGLELAGEVVRTNAADPEATRFTVGDLVMGITAGGGQAQLAVVHERQLMPIPLGLGLPAAGGVPETFTTAHDAIFTQCGLRAGERLLVHGAAGGVGTAAVQLGAAAGAHVTATVRNPEHREAVAALGAHEVLDPESFPASAGAGFDVILELVGAPNLPADLEALATGGRVVVIGVGAGARTEIDLRVLMGRRATLRASTLRARPLEEKAAAARAVERSVLPFFASGALSVPIAATFPLAEAAAAYERFAAGGKLGKVILEM